MVVIQTDRLRVRRFEAGDAQDLFAYPHRPGASCFLSMKLDDIGAARVEAVERSTSQEVLAIEHRASGRVIGEMAAHREPPDTVSVAWQLNTEFSGQGFALEAARAVLGHLFTQETSAGATLMWRWEMRPPNACASGLA